MVAIIAADITDTLLTQFDDDIEPDATTLTEIVERVKATYQSEATARIADVQRKASEEVASVVSAREKTREELRKKEEEHRNLVLNLRAKIITFARLTSWVFFVGVALILVVGPLFIGYNLVSTGTPVAKIVVYVITSVVWLAGVLRLLWGGHINQWRRSFELRVDRSLRKWFGITDTLKTLE
jgi:ABC-type multidrug transport system fused ATPase/permease subunit